MNESNQPGEFTTGGGGDLFEEFARLSIGPAENYATNPFHIRALLLCDKLTFDVKDTQFVLAARWLMMEQTLEGCELDHTLLPYDETLQAAQIETHFTEASGRQGFLAAGASVDKGDERKNRSPLEMSLKGRIVAKHSRLTKAVVHHEVSLIKAIPRGWTIGTERYGDAGQPDGRLSGRYFVDQKQPYLMRLKWTPGAVECAVRIRLRLPLKRSALIIRVAEPEEGQKPSLGRRIGKVIRRARPGLRADAVIALKQRVAALVVEKNILSTAKNSHTTWFDRSNGSLIISDFAMTASRNPEKVDDVEVQNPLSQPLRPQKAKVATRQRPRRANPPSHTEDSSET